MTQPILQLTAIDKSFGGVPALRGARLDVLPGEIHGLVGENGAGKSTLINVATGLLKADAGRTILAGNATTLSGPRHAAALGIAVVHQEADLFPQLSIAENMLLRRGLVRRGPFVDWPATYREAGRLVAVMGESADAHSGLNVRQPASGLSVARRMMAEIARGEHSSEIMDGPNIWRVKAGDRVAWVGPSRPDVPSADGVLAICEAAADVLVVGPMRMIQDLFDGSSASAAELTAEELQRCRAGYQAAVSLGLPRVVSAGQWALG